MEFSKKSVSCSGGSAADAGDIVDLRRLYTGMER